MIDISNKKILGKYKRTDRVYPKMFEYEHNQDDVYFDLIQLIVQTI